MLRHGVQRCTQELKMPQHDKTPGAPGRGCGEIFGWNQADCERFLHLSYTGWGGEGGTN